MLTRGVAVEYSDEDGRFRGAQIQVIDFEDHSANDWLAVSQVTVKENRQMRRADIVLFVNGLPFSNCRLTKRIFLSLFVFNGLLGISGGVPSVI